MATERHETCEDGGLAEAHVADDHHALAAGVVGSAQVSVHLLEEPLPAAEQPIGREPGNLKVQGLQVEGGSKINCRGQTVVVTCL